MDLPAINCGGIDWRRALMGMLEGVVINKSLLQEDESRYDQERYQ
jgi:hypothetical protein